MIIINNINEDSNTSNQGFRVVTSGSCCNTRLLPLLKMLPCSKVALCKTSTVVCQSITAKIHYRRLAVVAFTAWRLRFILSAGVAGIVFTSAPMSIRKRMALFWL